MAYYNPYYYSQYPYMYQNNQSYSSDFESMKWVDGEVGAKAFQMPSGWPPVKPIALWDSTEKKIFLKSWNQMGMANPMQELDYEIKERTNPALLPGNISGSETPQYVTRTDLDELKEEIKNLTKMISKANSETRGGSR